MQFFQPAQAGRQQPLIRAIAAITPIQQRHMAGFADQQPQPDDAQIAALALGMAPPRQFPRRLRSNVGVEVGGVESEHIGAELEAGDRSLGNRYLRLLQRRIGDLLRYAMKRLAR